jgi:hypothetical protein
MNRAILKTSYSAAQALPHPVTRAAKYSRVRRVRPCQHGDMAGLPAGFGVALQDRCKVVAAQVFDLALQSAFCNAQRLQRGFRAYVHPCEGGCGGAGAHDRARLSVATVALLHNGDKIYISISYRASNLQRPCNACNDGAVADQRPSLPVLAQAIENGLIFADGAARGGAALADGAQDAGFAGFGARAVGCRQAGQLAGWLGAERVRIAPGEAGSGLVSGLETWISETFAPIVQRYQTLDAYSPRVHKTRGEPVASPGPFGMPDMPPPLRGTPTPKAAPPTSLPAHRSAVFWPDAGTHPAKLRKVAAAPGSGRGMGTGLRSRVGAGSGQRVRQGRGVPGLGGCRP